METGSGKKKSCSKNLIPKVENLPTETAKKTIRRRQNYEKIDLITAVTDVKEKRLTITQAAQKYGVPRRTIQDHVSGTVSDFAKSGTKPQLTEEEELALVDYITFMSRKNLPLTRNDVRNTIVQLIRRSGEDRIAKCLFNLEKGPSDNWFQGFEIRHRVLKWVIPEPLKYRNTHYSDYELDNFFATYENSLKTLGILHKPAQIFSVGLDNELAPSSKAYGVKGETLYRAKNASLDGVTAIMTVGADGTVLPSFLLYSESLSSMSVQEEMPKSWLYDISTSGQMDEKLFKKWFNDLFLLHCGQSRPVVLILDNEGFSMTQEMIQTAKENQVEILCLPDNTTHFLQPLDAGIFENVKKKYSQLCVTAGFKSSRLCFLKPGFPQAWSNCIKQSATSTVVKQGFRRTGIYPFNPLQIERSQVKSENLIECSSVPEPAAIVTTSTSAAMDYIKQVNMSLGPIVNEHSPCPTCGMYPHPVESVRKLAPEIVPAFPIPGETKQFSRDKKTVQKSVVEDSDNSDSDQDIYMMEQQQRTIRLEEKCKEMGILASEQLNLFQNKRKLEDEYLDDCVADKRIALEQFEIESVEVEVVDSDL